MGVATATAVVGGTAGTGELEADVVDGEGMLVWWHRMVTPGFIGPSTQSFTTGAAAAIRNTLFI